MTACPSPSAASPAPVSAAAFRGEARYGKDHSDRQTFYGFRLHARLTWPSLISEVMLVPTNASAQSALPHLAASAPGGCTVLGDRNYCVPRLKVRLAADGQRLLRPPARQAKRDPPAVRGGKWPYSDTRYRIDCIFGQLTDRFHVKRMWARDLWPLMGLFFRKVLVHTRALILNMEQGNSPLRFERLV